MFLYLKNTITSFQNNRGFGIVMYLIAEPLKYREIKSEQADTRTVTRLHS